MASITALKPQINNPDRISIYVDGSYAFSLYAGQVLEEKLKKGEVVDNTRITQLKERSSEGKLRSRALEWVLSRPRSERELREYLRRKKCSSKLSDKLVEEFICKRYIDDTVYARWFADQKIKRGYSVRLIAAQLKAKGVSPATIQSIVKDQSEQSIDEKSIALLVNKLRNRSRYKDKDKLIRYLLSKGFTYSSIKGVLEE